MDEFINITGSKADIKSVIAEILGKDDSEIPKNFLDFINKYIEGDSENSIEEFVTYPSFPPGVIGLMVQVINYNINIKRGLLLSIALIIDLLGANGIASFLAAIAGIPSQVISKIEINNGELCCLKICLEEKNVSDFEVYFVLSNLPYCPNHQCEHYLNDKCKISTQNIKENLETLTAKGAVIFKNGRYSPEL